jgi:cation transport regulator ChaC
MSHHLFGYGSLISRESRHRTATTGDSMPVRIRGLQRAWNIIAPEMKMAGVGVTLDESASCNGVLMEIDESELAAFDRRELESTNYSYQRLQIPTGKITGLTAEISDLAQVWAYIVKKTSTPTSEFPIVQSYVDVILTGCLEIGEEFAIEFIRSTAGWERPWIDDRANPRYVRHLQKNQFQRQIDGLLAEHASSGFVGRKDVV